MKPLRLLLALALLSLATAAVAQDHSATSNPAPKTEAEKSFDALKTLAGKWTGPVTVNPPMHGNMEKSGIEVSLRVTSRGNALVHEMKGEGTPDDPTRYDHPVTMLYLDAGQLALVHYCDAGNRPHMTGALSPDGKKVEFDFVDLSGSNKFGHMYHAVFNFIDANHHTEDWTYMMPGDKPMYAHMDLTRVQ